MIYLMSLLAALAVAMVEAVSYPGYLANNTGIGSQYFYLISVIFSFLPHNFPGFIKKLINYSAYALGVVYTVLIILEKSAYPNYVFTKFHINLLTLLLLLALLWYHNLRLKSSNFLKSLLVASLIYIGFGGLGGTLEVMIREIRRISSQPFATYDEKMAKAYPDFYPAMKEVVKLTPENAVILIPPQGHPWELEGNSAMVNYFIYPRKSINYVPGDPAQLKPGTYILIADGSWRTAATADYGWPKNPVQSNKIIQIDLQAHTNYVHNRSYDPGTDKWDWGLIEVAND